MEPIEAYEIIVRHFNTISGRIHASEMLGFGTSDYEEELEKFRRDLEIGLGCC